MEFYVTMTHLTKLANLELGYRFPDVEENDLTIVSIFVNPAQFAPHEDLNTYPRTVTRDLELLSAQSVTVSNGTLVRTTDAVFLPSVQDMYPSRYICTMWHEQPTNAYFGQKDIQQGLIL
jgi:pantothenate synthetase